MIIGQALISSNMTFLKGYNVSPQMVAMVSKMRPLFLWAIRELKVGANILANLCLETLMVKKYGKKIYLD